MATGNLRLTLLLGSDKAPHEVMRALRGVQVTRGEEAPSTFQLTFHTERLGTDGGEDFPIVNHPKLQTFSRVTLQVAVGGSARVLVDGYITGRQLSPGGAPGGTTFVVSGEDVSVKMNMMEISFEYPHIGDFAIVELILAKYIPFKILPDAKPTVADIIPLDFVPQQNSTDRQYLQQMALKHAYRFYIVPGPSPGWNRAYWGPPVLTGMPQKALTVDMGPGTNVENIAFSENALAPTMTYGTVLQTLIPPPFPIPILAPASTRSPALAAEPLMGSYGELLTEALTNPLGLAKKLLTLEVRGSLLQNTNYLQNLQQEVTEVIPAQSIAMANTNQSTDDAVTVEGRLDAARYGAVLDAPGLVGVRGAGQSFDGVWYVKKVVHQMSTVQGNWSYKQSFTLTREGLGSTVSGVPT